MPHISRKKVSNKVLKRITGQFFDSIYKQGRSNLRPFLINLLTDTEEIMLAKRLAVIAMLVEGIGYYKIRKFLKVSTSTIKRIDNNLSRDEYSDVEKWFKKEKNKKTFWSDMEKLFRAGMPPIVGKGRWSFLDEYIKNKKAQKIQ
jgi:uncharacterized protein YerC